MAEINVIFKLCEYALMIVLRESFVTEARIKLATNLGLDDVDLVLGLL